MENKKDTEDDDESFWIIIKMAMQRWLFGIKNLKMYVKRKGQSKEDYEKMCKECEKARRKMRKEAIFSVIRFPWEAFKTLLLVFILGKEWFVYIMSGIIKEIIEYVFLFLFYLFVLFVIFTIIASVVWVIIEFINILQL